MFWLKDSGFGDVDVEKKPLCLRAYTPHLKHLTRLVQIIGAVFDYLCVIALPVSNLTDSF